jgi:hypothetical protein
MNLTAGTCAALSLMCGLATAHGQDPYPLDKVITACGPPQAQFRVAAAPAAPPLAATSNQATIYIVAMSFDGWLSGPVVRIGMDGAWVGAVKGSSWFALRVSPGVHHFCARRQTSANSQDDPEFDIALNVLDAKPGSVHYLTMAPPYIIGPGIMLLEENNPDEALLLMEQSRPVTAIEKPRRKR